MGKDGRDGRRVHTINVTHKISGGVPGGVAGLMERIKRLSSQKVCVGVPSADDLDLTDKQKEEIKRENEKQAENKGQSTKKEIGNADLVYIHTHGVRPRAAREEMQPEINKGTKYSVALQMYIHEHGSMVYQVPPRPIIEPAIKDSKEGIGEALGIAAKQAVEGKDAHKALEDVGLYAQSKVKDWFTDPKNGWAPNAPSTIAKKRLHSDQPLIDTGALRDSITFVIREGEK